MSKAALDRLVEHLRDLLPELRRYHDSLQAGGA